MLPIKFDYPPMEAQLVAEVPASGDWLYEPKWDGFRSLAFRDGKEVVMRSKSGQPLDRYFPEVQRALAALACERFVLDGEIVVPSANGFSFDDLLERIHPAASRIKKLAAERPALFIVFDILVDEHGTSLVGKTIEERRQLLDRFSQKYMDGNKQILLSPATTDYEVAQEWWKLVGKELDGIIAKKRGIPYQSANRKGMVKVKKLRTADVVVGGFRYASDSDVVGSLLLGLYDDEGLLHHVGFTSAFKAAEKKELTKRLEPMIEQPGFTGNAPGGPSRWSTERSAEWQPLRTELVVEVQYDHFTGDRFRHGTKILRWRPDKKPAQCTFDQVRTSSRSGATLLSGA
jgi:ATP-dependent DNA ligase